MLMLWVAKIRDDSGLRMDFENWIAEQRTACLHQALAAHNMETLSMLKGRVQTFDLILQMLNKPEIEDHNAR